MQMDLANFFDRSERKNLQLESSEKFISLLDYFKVKDFSISFEKNNYYILREAEKISLDAYFDKVISRNILSLHNSIVDYYTSYNHFLDNLPLFIIRRHGTHSGPEGGKKRRRGWLVKFNNAWIVYADNFISRHIFEFNYFSDSLDPQELAKIILNLRFPFSSGGGRLENLNRIFPSLSHFSSKSNLYLSHLYDLNTGTYSVNNKNVLAKNILGANDEKFGYGASEEWNNPIKCYLGLQKYFKHFDFELSGEELQFLKTYNIRMLSPLNYFPFPKPKLLKNSAVNGESVVIRKLFKDYTESIYGKNIYSSLE